MLTEGFHPGVWIVALIVRGLLSLKAVQPSTLNPTKVASRRLTGLTIGSLIWLSNSGADDQWH